MQSVASAENFQEKQVQQGRARPRMAARGGSQSKTWTEENFSNILAKSEEYFDFESKIS